MIPAIMEERVRRVFRDVWGFEARKAQLDAVLACLRGEDVFVGIATGQGKSLCYQCVPLCLLQPKLVLVVSPLQALISDQIHRFEEVTGYKGLHIRSGNDVKRFLKTPDQDVRLVFMAPEQFTSPECKELFLAPPLPIALVAVDEAHCISEWGANFRTAFFSIGDVRAVLDSVHRVPFMALTATATKEVQDVATTKLHLKKPTIVKGSLDRRNIFLVCKKLSSMKADLGPLLEVLKQASDPSQVEKHLIYLPKKQKLIDVWELCRSVCCPRIKRTVRAFHADMSNVAKEMVLDAFRDGTVRVVISSIAFGMGIDIPDVKGVVVYGMPSSVGQLYQQIGRAGRRGDEAHAIFFHSKGDAKIDGIKAVIQTRGCLRKELLKQLGQHTREDGEEHSEELEEGEEGHGEQLEEHMEEGGEEHSEELEEHMGEGEEGHGEQLEEHMEEGGEEHSEELEEHMGEDGEEHIRCCSACNNEDNSCIFTAPREEQEGSERGVKRKKAHAKRREDTNNEEELETRLFNLRDSLFDANPQFLFIGPCAIMSDNTIKLIVRECHKIHTVEDLDRVKGVPRDHRDLILAAIDDLIPEKAPTTKRGRRTAGNRRVLRDITNTQI